MAILSQALTSEDLDTICNVNGSLMYRINGVWTCGRLDIPQDNLTSNNLAQPIWDDVISPIINIASSQQAPTFEPTVQSYAFGNDVLASQDYVYVQIQLPHGYKESSEISCHLHWLPSSTNNGYVNFSMAYFYTDINETQSAITTISAKSQASGTALKHQLLDFPDIANANGKLSAVLKAKITRESADASDTFTGDAYVDYFDCHIQKDTIASIYEYQKR